MIVEKPHQRISLALDLIRFGGYLREVGTMSAMFEPRSRRSWRRFTDDFKIWMSGTGRESADGGL